MAAAETCSSDSSAKHADLSDPVGEPVTRVAAEGVAAEKDEEDDDTEARVPGYMGGACRGVLVVSVMDGGLKGCE